MTVQELIEKLKTFPPDLDIIYACYSDFEIMDECQITLNKAEEKQIKFRQGRYSRHYPEHRDIVPIVFKDVVVFPGN